MALINIKFASEVLGRATDINVILPQKSTQGQIGIQNKAGDGKYKTLLLLHGLSDDNSIWQRHTSIDRYAVEAGVAVVMPSADRSFYTDMKYGDRYYTYISDEVLRIAREFLPLSDKREDNFIAGNSMGGYGALKIALRNPDKFAAVAGLSAATDIERTMAAHAPDLRECVFGQGKIEDTEDLFYLAKECDKLEVKPRIFMGVGFEDFLYEDNIKFRDALNKLHYDFTYRESKGGHGWDFWDEYIQYVLKWMLD